MLYPPTVGKDTAKTTRLSEKIIQVAEGCCALGAQRAERSGGPLIFGLHLLHQGKRWKRQKKKEPLALKASYPAYPINPKNPRSSKAKKWKSQNKEEYQQEKTEILKSSNQRYLQ
jgi:hypothetical protein